MPFIAAFGFDVPFEVFQSELAQLKECQQKASANSHACAEACTKKFSSPAEAVAGVNCVNGCFIQGQARGDDCLLIFLANLGFQGAPDDDKDPQGFFQEQIKQFFPATRKVFITAALLAGVYGGATRRKAGALNLAMKARGTNIVIAGAVLFGIERFMKDVLNDPPDDDFNLVFEARKFNLQEILASLDLDSTETVLFLPWLTAALQVLTRMEGIAVSLDRASGAEAAGDLGAHLAQLRVSQRYAKACSEALMRTQSERLSLATKMAALAIAEESEEQLIVSHADAAAVHNAWKQGEFDEGVRGVIEHIARSKDEADSIVDSFSNQPLSEDMFGRSIPEMLRSPDLTGAENELILGLDTWEAFYRS